MPTSVDLHAPDHELVGELGEEHFGFSDLDVRLAERASGPGTIETADGPVTYEDGDFIVSMPSGERYPIPARMYFGTYQQLGQIGDWTIGRRLIHLRRVWPVTSDAVELTYPDRRARLHAARGAWIYKCDDDDLGIINADVNTKTHSIIGTAKSQAGVDWQRKHDRACDSLIALPPILTALALAALAVATKEPQLARFLIGLECALLLAGSLLAAWMRRDRWALRAAASSGMKVAERFQVAVQALGQRPSTDYPLMALWRSAQTDEPPPAPPKLEAECIAQVSAAIDVTREEIRHALHHAHQVESRVDFMSWAGVFIIVACLIPVMLEPGDRFKTFKLLAAWLPAALGMAHAFAARRQSLANVVAGKQLLLELKFLRTRLLAATTVVPASSEAADAKKQAHDCIRMLCGRVAAYTHHGLEAATGMRAHPPA